MAHQIAQEERLITDHRYRHPVPRVPASVYLVLERDPFASRINQQVTSEGAERYLEEK